MSALATPAEFKSYVPIDDSADDVMIGLVLNAATAWIESPQGCGRTFTSDVADVTRTYWPYEPGRILVDDQLTVTSIAIDTTGNRTFTTLLVPGDYLLWPLNGPPYQEIRSWNLARYWFLTGQLVRVVGKAGFVDASGIAPESVRLACLMLAARWFARRQAPFGVIEVPSTGQMARIASEDVDVHTLITPYIKSRGTFVVV